MARFESCMLQVRLHDVKAPPAAPATPTSGLGGCRRQGRLAAKRMMPRPLRSPIAQPAEVVIAWLIVDVGPGLPERLAEQRQHGAQGREIVGTEDSGFAGRLMKTLCNAAVRDA